MFVRDFIHVGQPFEVVAPRFVRDTSWLAPIAEEAAAVARDIALSLVPRGGSPDGDAISDGRGTHSGSARAHQIRCEVGPVRARAHSILVPMWLITEGSDRALPDLTGDLEVAPVGATRSLIALDATYQRTTAERAELQRMERATEAGVRTFLSGIAVFLAASIPAV